MAVEFSPEQREGLGIGPRESLRVPRAMPRTSVLERVGGESGNAYPWDRDLVLSADVRAFPIADVLQLIHTGSKSGFLSFEHGDHAKSVYLHRGEVVFAASNQVVDRLGECLLRLGRLSPEQFRESNRGYSPPGHFGRVLVRKKFLTPREIWNGVRAQVEEIVRSLFAYTGGTVLFFEGEIRPDNVVRLSLPTQRLILDGLRQRDELLRFLTLVEDPRVRLTPLRGERLGGTERAIFDAIGREPSFAGICRCAGIDPLSGARTLQLLRLMGAVAIERSDEGPPVAADARSTCDDAVRACVARHVKLLAELAAPIVAVEGTEGMQERLGQVVSDAAERFPELLGGLEVGAGGSLDPDELGVRAARIPGDREAAVRTALGELISYVEFDLLNHPGLGEPEIFLDALEELRASL